MILDTTLSASARTQPSRAFSKLFALSSLIIAGFALASVAKAEAPITYTWTGAGGNSLWNNRSNWSPDPGSSAIGTTTATRYDGVLISGNSAVTYDRNLTFSSGSISDNDKKVTFTAIKLQNNASFTLTGNLTVSSASGGFIRDVEIGAGSTLSVSGIFSFGAPASTLAKATLTVNGTLNVNTFAGKKSTSATSPNNGGFIINIDGGAMNVEEAFGWNEHTTAPSLDDTVGHVTLSNGGSLTVGSFIHWTGAMDGDNYVNFADDTGSLIFGKTGFETVSLVQSLIDDAYIRMGTNVDGALSITDLGAQWQITVGAVIPEPASAAVLTIGLASLGLFFSRRRLR